MVVVMQERATDEQVQRGIAQLVEMGFDVPRATGALRTVIGAVGGRQGDPALIEVLDGVKEGLRITEPYKLASRTFKPENPVGGIGDLRICGAFKPRSSPYSFQGLGEEGLRLLRSAADRHNLKLVSEIMDLSQLDLMEKYADILHQIQLRSEEHTSELQSRL